MNAFSLGIRERYPSCVWVRAVPDKIQVVPAIRRNGSAIGDRSAITAAVKHQSEAGLFDGNVFIEMRRRFGKFENMRVPVTRFQFLVKRVREGKGRNNCRRGQSDSNHADRGNAQPRERA